MNIKEKILLDRKGLGEFGPINIVIFGDSVSHGAVMGYNDYENVYWNLLKKRLNQFRDYMPVNMINVSIGGTTAKQSLPRLEKQALIHQPDLMIISFGLNDVMEDFGDYIASLREMFRKCLEAKCDVIFMTPNMLNTYVAEDTGRTHWEYAHKTAEMQNSDRMDTYMYAAKELAESMGVTVCDCYTRWKELSKKQDTTMMLANRINHPTAEMHELFAEELFKCIFAKKPEVLAKQCSTMWNDN